VSDDVQQLNFYQGVHSLGNSKAIKYTDSFLSVISFTWYRWSQGKNFHWPYLALYMLQQRPMQHLEFLMYFCAFGWSRAQSLYSDSELLSFVCSIQIPNSSGTFWRNSLF